MQRDVYASLIKKRHKQMVPLLIHQVSGDITRENIFDEVFHGYKLRRIVLMTHMAATPATLPRLPRDIIVSDFDKLRAIHQPHFHYKLLPLLCTDFEAFSALQGICASANSPFTIEDRKDPQGLTHRLSNGCSERQALCEFFDPHIAPAEKLVPVFSRKLPISAVVFDGLLLKQNYPKVAALLTVHEAASEKSIIERAIMRDFFVSPLYTKVSGNSDVAQSLRLVHHCTHFMALKRAVGSDAPSRQSLMRLAAEKKLFMYEKIGDEYQFVH
ncbi:hypothetical protein, conserved [Trypanosoma brucei gambiense DAL972]|uniref:Uncharacterized protein n=1 Tax=Trypanosoma brucei gambiense (strain MHOM/CI/86/DAL972) TaxID=679716 RepID=C9ZIA1_TRYB9|nr:hypothetical protein, conserved [Trypanosoma brucei gambiense DAL972]CBH08893.1 hypothetical protein, conserved [Trypanosoma brucei gambiense DAL972]|eukprot:XP_011771334.1 hypothetical protein, conserved [Trypanosoma brucei gambiense DAL972]